MGRVSGILVTHEVIGLSQKCQAADCPQSGLVTVHPYLQHYSTPQPLLDSPRYVYSAHTLLVEDVLHTDSNS